MSAYTPVETSKTTREEGRTAAGNFIREIIEEDLRTGKHETIVTRFPPEPNGYLHIGHAKAIWLDFGVARDYGGRCNLRFDDTNPETEEVEFVESIQESVRWLGYQWHELRYASDYFEQFYQYALKLIRKGKAYVDSLSEEEIREYRGTVTEPGRPSPYRERSIAENLDLFERMKAGAFEEGMHVLRAKGDLTSPNMKMRDPLLYRIRHAKHYHLEEDWHIFPFYDFAHPLEDAIEGVTHSLCTLEFDNNREIYDWVLENCLEPEELPTRPHQYEFSRLVLDYTVMSKRKLLQLVGQKYVNGWDDPRMPTLFGVRRRGVRPEAVRMLCERTGVTKVEGRVDPELFDHIIRDDLNFEAPRVMAVLRPLKVVLTNYPEGQVEWLDAPYWPHDVPKEGTRKVPFSRELYIEADDFMENPSKKFFRLAPGREVRLRYGYFITCQEVVKDAEGNVTELRCTYDPATRGGDSPDGRRPKATLHWLSAAESIPTEVRLYDRLFTVPNPDAEPGDFKDYLNPGSLVVVEGARVEPSVADDPAETRYQFERLGYFWRDPVDSRPDALVFNRIVNLRDTWAKIARSEEPAEEAMPARPAKEEARPAVAQVSPLERLSADARSRFEYLETKYGIGIEEGVVLAREPQLAAYFEEAVPVVSSCQLLANWITHELAPALKGNASDEIPVPASSFAKLVHLVDAGTITSAAGREVLSVLLSSGGDPEAIVRERNLVALNDRGQLESTIDQVIAANPDKASSLKEGRIGLLGFFVGQVMRQTGGRANPTLVQDLIREKLGLS